ncbi:factor-independent urate hydroxylase [uncultured Chitinophaga sp.]|jgi:urate oxidase|uniref:factor-independent urate hydroxylase n=1 Tax=uncultured Chitinophaga sp. TaxID=339340 RepID=UPI0026294F40|nr:urate oxidase [uncultured Chitinophaga sp.]
MKIKLGENMYGKNAVHLSKIIRHTDHHEFRQISVNISLEGDFETAYTQGDNTKILPTDTQKNTVYALAKDHFTGSIEDFGIYLANYLLNNNPQVSQAQVEITEHLWSRMAFEAHPHPHAYASSGSEKRTTLVKQNRTATSVRSGFKDLLILKTTDSGFENYIKDKYTTLKETNDRILATQCEASWLYTAEKLDFNAVYNGIRNTLLHTFAFHKSLSVQQTLFDMGKAVLENIVMVKEISLIMPNKHHIPFNLEQFGMQNNNDIFIATDAPYGYITGTISRD